MAMVTAEFRVAGTLWTVKVSAFVRSADDTAATLVTLAREKINHRWGVEPSNSALRLMDLKKQ